MSKEPKPRVLMKTWSEVRLAGKLGSDAQPPTAVTPEPPTEWLGHLEGYFFLGFFESPCCNLALKNKAKPSPGLQSGCALG